MYALLYNIRLSASSSAKMPNPTFERPRAIRSREAAQLHVIPQIRRLQRIVEARYWTLELLERTIRTQGGAGPISREAFYDWGFQDTLAIGKNRPGLASGLTSKRGSGHRFLSGSTWGKRRSAVCPWVIGRGAMSRTRPCFQSRRRWTAR